MSTLCIEKNGDITEYVLCEGDLPLRYERVSASESVQPEDIFLAKADRVCAGLEAMFVQLGNGLQAFLPFSECVNGVPASGKLIPVQVKRAPHGNKCAYVTRDISLAGKYLILLPYSRTVSVSSRITDPQERNRLLAIAHENIEGFGVILRTQAENIPDSVMIAEAEELKATFRRLEERITSSSVPCRLSGDSNPAEVFLRDEKDIERVLCSEPMDLPVPVTVTEKPVSAKLRRELEQAFRRNVWLPCGGYLTVDLCEALTVFDVNSGKYTGSGKSADKSFLRLNTEAARKCAEILRLRNIGGNILIDFVDMKTDGERDAVIDTMTEAFRQDRAKTVIYGFTKLGLMEISRKRTGTVQTYTSSPEKEER